MNRWYSAFKQMVCVLVCITVSGCAWVKTNTEAVLPDQNRAPLVSGNSDTEPPDSALPADQLSVKKIPPAPEKPSRPPVQELSIAPVSEISPVGNPRADAVKARLSRPVKSKDRHAAAPNQAVSLNFDEADLYEVIRTMAEVLQINYMVATGIQGSVTIHTEGSVSREDLFKLFFQILEINGLTAVQEGDLYKIMNREDAATAALPLRYGRNQSKLPKAERLVIQIIPLTYTSAQDLAQNIPPFLSPAGSVVTTKLDNVLVVIDKNSQLERILQMVDLFDVDVFDRFHYRFIPLKFTPADEISELISALMSPFADSGAKNWELVPISRRNTIVAVSANENVLDRIERFIEKIDVEESSSQSRLFIYKVKNSKAEDLAALLSELFSPPETEDGKSKSGSLTPNALGKVDNKAETGTKTEPPQMFGALNKKSKTTENTIDSSTGMGALGDDVRIVSDTVQNVLIIDASPSDYQSILRVLNELDVVPRQVLINVLVVNINLTDSLDLGVEWAFTKDAGYDKGLLTGTTIGEKGLQLLTGLSSEWKAAVSALASDDKAEILSSPSLLASDNESATMNVSTQIPIETSSFASDSGVTTTTVQYRDTGIILNVTPRISDHGTVSMEISQEVSNQAESTSEGNPSFFTRNVTTTLTVNDGQTVVIGGLISTDTSDTNAGFPLLKDIPLIGPLFGKQGKSVTKNELAIFITPHVIKQPDDIERVSKDFINSMKELIHNERLKTLYQ